MADFTIAFENNLQFVFSDITDYSAISGETDSKLFVTYPSIAENDNNSVDPIELDLYNENIAAFGDDFTFVVADEDDLVTLTTGTYRFTLVIYDSGGSELASKTKYYNNEYDIQVCLRRRTDSIMDKQCSDDWDEIGHINALLDVAEREATQDRYTQAQEIFDYLISKCNEC